VDLDLARVALGLGFLAVAAAMDWRRRVVKDGVWIAMGAASLGLGQLDILLAGLPPYLHLMGLATGVLYFGVFFGRPIWDEDGFHVRPPRFALFVLAPVILFLVWRRSADDPIGLDAFWKLLTMPAMIVVAHGMYEFGLLRGGADAKAVMALALLFPGVYPAVGSLPLLRPLPAAASVLAVVFPFAFVVLVNSALLFLVVPLAFLARNLAAGDAKLPRALFGYRVPLDGVPKYAWLMDRIEDGKAVHTYFPRRAEDREEQLRLLREHGFEKVWVTPQLPFVTAMLVGFVLAVVVGNPLLALFGAFGG
jgi:hypothetical protein